MRLLADDGAPVDPDAMYLVKIAEHMIWPYDDEGRLVGEDVWEYDETVREIIALDPADVLTVEQAGKLLDPLIKPLPASQPVHRLTTTALDDAGPGADARPVSPGQQPHDP